MVTQAKLHIEDQQRLQHLEQSQLIGYWAKTKGIRADDLVRHARIDDVILLIRFRDELWHDMTKGQHKSWDCYWNWCYRQKKPLRNKHLKKLEHISISALNTRHYKKLKAQYNRQRIQALKQNPTTIR